MKKLRRIISGFLAAALVLTQSVTTAYSQDLPDAAVTLTQASETAPPPEDADDVDNEDASADEEEAPDEDEKIDESDAAPAEESVTEVQNPVEFISIGGELLPVNDIIDSEVKEISSDELIRINKEYNVNYVAENQRGTSSKYSSDYLYGKMGAMERSIYDTFDTACKAILNSSADYTQVVNFSDGTSAKLIAQAEYSGISESVASAVVSKFRFSNPQYYFVSTLIGTGSYSDSAGTHYNVSIYFINNDGHDFSIGQQRNNAKAALDSLTSAWMTDINAVSSPLEKERVIINKIVDYITYDDYATGSSAAQQDRLTFDQTLISSILNPGHVTVCAGYAMMTAYFCNAANMDCFYVNSNGHAWNMVNLYGNYYEIDLTWYDTGGRNEKWINKSHATFLSNDSGGNHVYKSSIWSTTTLPPTPYDTVIEDTSLKSVSVKKNPTKLTYFVGEAFEPDGCVLTLSYAGNFTEEVSLPYTGTDHEISYNYGTFTTAGRIPVTITCDEKTATVYATVSAVAVSTIAVTTAPLSLTYNYGTPVTFANGILTVTYNNGDTAAVDMGEAFADGTLTVSGYNANKLGPQTITLLYGGKTTTIVVNVIVDPTDPPVTMGTTNYLTITDALNAITAAGEYTITVNKNAELSAITIPAKATKVTLKSANDSFIRVNSITANADLVIDANVSVYTGTADGPDMTIAANKTVTVSGEVVPFNKITGAANTKLVIGSDSNPYAETISGVTTVESNGLLGIGSSIILPNLTGRIYLFDSVTTATITNVSGASGVVFNYSANKLAPLTVTNIPEGATFDVRVVDEDYNMVPVASGTNIFKAAATSADYSSRVSIFNKTNGNIGKPLSVFKYGTDLRAEVATAITLKVDGIAVGNFPNLEKAFAAVQANKKNVIALNEDVDATSFTLPSNLGTGSLEIVGDSEVRLLKLHSLTTIAPKYDFAFKDVELIPLTNTGAQASTFSIIGSKNVELNNVICAQSTAISVTVGAGGVLALYGNSAKFATLTGTATSSLYVGGGVEDADNIKTFKTVSLLSVFTLNNSATGIAALTTTDSSSFVLAPASSAAITTLGSASGALGANIALNVTSPTSLVLPALTVTNIDYASTIAVTTTAGAIVTVPSGTNILKAGSASVNFTDKLTILNKTAAGKTLNAYLYGTDVRAETDGAVTLDIYELNAADGDDPISSRSYPNIDLAFKDTKPNYKNAITLGQDVVIKATSFPVNLGAGSLEILSPYDENGPAETYTVDLNGATTLTAKYDFMLNNVKLKSLGRYDNPVQSITISSTANLATFDLQLATENANTPVTISVTGKDSYLGIGGIGFKVNTITSGNSSYGWFEAQTSMTVENIINIGGFETADGATLTITGKVSGITDVLGNLVFGDKSNVTVNSLSGANITLIDGDGAGLDLPAFATTYLNVYTAGDTTITVKDKAGTIVPIPSGTKVFTMNCTEAHYNSENFGGHIKLGNKTPTGQTLNAFYYNKEIRAEYAGAITLDILDENFNTISTQNFPNFEKAFAATQKNRYNYIKLKEDVDAAKFVLPTDLGTTTNNLSIFGNGHKLTLNGVTTLQPRYNFCFSDVELIVKTAQGAYAPTLTITGSKFVTLDIVKCDPANTVLNVTSGAGCGLYIDTCTAKFGNVTGTATSELYITGSTDVNKITTFKAVNLIKSLRNDFATLNVSGAVTGVTALKSTIGGEVVLGTAATATIADISGVKLTLTTDAASAVKLQNLTLTKVSGASTITVKNSAGTVISLPSGTAVFKASNTEADFNAYGKPNLTIANKTADGKTLEPFYYNREIRAEVATAITLTVEDENGNVVSSQNFPNFEKAFPAAQVNKTNTITLNEDIDAAKFTLPTNLGTTGTLTIKSAAGVKTLTLNNLATLSPRYGFTIENIKIVSLDRNGNNAATFAINGGGAVTLEGFSCASKVNVTASGANKTLTLKNNNCDFGRISGSTTGKLSVAGAAESAANVATFKDICLETPFTITGGVTGVTNLTTSGTGCLVFNSGAAATITNLVGASVKLVDDAAAGIKLPTFNVTGVTAASTITVVDADGAVITIPSGTKIFTMTCTEQVYYNNSYGAKITFTNKTATDQTLNAFYYNRDIRAEYAGTLTLVSGTEAPANYPNFELALKAAKQNVDNVITMNEDADAAKFTLPTNLGTTGTLTIKSAAGVKTLTLNNIASLSPRYDFTIENVKLVSLDRNGNNAAAFAITGGGAVTLEGLDCASTVNVTASGANKTLTLKNNNCDFGRISGSTTGKLSVAGAAESAANIATFKDVSLETPFTITGGVTGVTNLTTSGTGSLILAEKATATITNVGSANLVLTEKNSAITKATVNTIATALTVTIVDDNGNQTVLVSGAPILYAGTATDISGKVTVVNKDANGGNLQAVTYGKEIRAEVPNAIKLSINGAATASFTSFEKLFEYVTNAAKTDRTNQNTYVITLYSDLSTKVFTLPNYGAGFTVKSDAGHNYRLELKGVTVGYKSYPVNFENVNVSFVKA